MGLQTDAPEWRAHRSRNPSRGEIHPAEVIDAIGFLTFIVLCSAQAQTNATFLQDVSYVITEPEKEAFQNLETDAERDLSSISSGRIANLQKKSTTSA
jgi:hypothetical protein